MNKQKLLPMDERVRKAATRFNIDPDRVKISIMRTYRRMEEHSKHQFVQSKVTRARLKRIDAAVRTLEIETMQLPDPLRSFICAIVDAETLGNIRSTCDMVLEAKPDVPKRHDAHLKQVLAREAWRLLDLPTTVTPELVELAAILYGTGRAANVRRACRTVVEREAKSRPRNRAHTEAQIRAETAAQIRATLEKLHKHTAHIAAVSQKRYVDPSWNEARNWWALSSGSALELPL
jgi:hypothetical protein